MKLIELHIYGYGKLENVQIGPLNQLQVFYGENEAGKSTIMSFIHSILFGFPAKHSSELRYEPKGSSRYGGKIKAIFPDTGIAVIERVKGKASGDVTVSLEDGTIGGEELLRDLLQRMDKNIFQSIFSFNIHGLQNIHGMKGDDLGRYLFSAGTLGTDQLFNVETALLKEMEQRFKPSGKKPLLNEKLKELKDVQASLQKAEHQNAQYSHLVSELETLKKNIGKLEDAISELEHHGVRLREYRRNEQIVIEAASLQKKLEEYGRPFFPQDGLNRFEKVDAKLKQIQVRLQTLQEKQAALEKEVESSRPDTDLLHAEAEIESRLENVPLYEQMKQEKRLLEMKVEELTEEISRMNDQLNIDFDENSIDRINTSMFMKEQAERIQHGQQRLAEKRLELEAAFDEEKRALAALKSRADSMKRDMLPENQRRQMESDLKVLENKEQIQSELNQLRDQIAVHKAGLKLEETRKRTQKTKDLYQLVLFSAVMIMISLWGIANSQWLLLTIGAAGLFMLLAIHYKASAGASQADADEVLPLLLKREKELAEKLNRQPEGNASTFKGMLDKDDELRQRQRELNVKINEQQSRYDKVLKQFEQWEADEALLNREKASLLERLGIGESSEPVKVLDAFNLLDKQKQYFRERARAEGKLSAIFKGLVEMEEALTGLGVRFLQNGNLAPQETAVLLKKKLREAVDLKARHHEVIVKLQELEEEYVSLVKEKQLLAGEREQLLEQAQARDEEQFRRHASEDEQVKNWVARLADLEHQLSASAITKLDREQILTGIAIEERITENSRAVDESKKNLSEQINRLADVKHQMRVLEEGGLYSELLHKYKQLQQEFAEDAKEWAKYAVAKDVLSKTIDRYKEERMPRMLKKAESFLSALTAGAYVRIIPQVSSNGFLIERKDHMLFAANELSQATAEQVYVSIRLALAAVHYDRHPFPVIIDDSFVNFDHNRTARIIELLEDMGSKNQVLFFTCHRHLLEHFREEQILRLEENCVKID